MSFTSSALAGGFFTTSAWEGFCLLSWTLIHTTMNFLPESLLNDKSDGPSRTTVNYFTFNKLCDQRRERHKMNQG